MFISGIWASKLTVVIMSQVPAEDLPIGVVKKRNEGMLRVWKQVDMDAFEPPIDA